MGFLDAAQRILNSLGVHVDVMAYVMAFGLAVARIGTAISAAPFLGGKQTNNNIKIGLSVVMTAIILPTLQLEPAAGKLSSLTFVALLIKESLIGFTIGYLTQLVFYGVQMAGALIDNGRGMDQPALVAPQLPGNLSVLAQFKFQAAIVVFLVMNGHLIYLRALAQSFQRLPLFTFPGLNAGGTGTAERIASISGQVFVIAIQLAAPVMITLFLVDVCFGAIGKVAPQIHLHQESQPVKSFVGLIVLAVSIGFIFTRLESVLSRMMWNVTSVLAGLA